MTRELASERLTEDAFTADGEEPGFDASALASIRRDLAAWREGPVLNASRGLPPRLPRFSTWSGVEVPDLATPVDARGAYGKELGLPGEYPFTRGVQPTMYRGKL